MRVRRDENASGAQFWVQHKSQVALQKERATTQDGAVQGGPCTTRSVTGKRGGKLTCGTRM